VARDVRVVATGCILVDASASENFNNLRMSPPVCEAATLPLPIVGETGSPIRAIGLLP